MVGKSGFGFKSRFADFVKSGGFGFGLDLNFFVMVDLDLDLSFLKVVDLDLNIAGFDLKNSNPPCP